MAANLMKVIKVTNFAKVANVAKDSGAGPINTIRTSLSPRRDSAGPACQCGGLTVPASKAVTKERIATNPSATPSPAWSETNPINGAPTSRPVYPAVATAPMAVPDARPGVRPPAPRAIGKATASPAPTQANQITAAGMVPISSAPVMPRLATRPPTRTSRSAPNWTVRESPAKRIPAIASADAA